MKLCDAVDAVARRGLRYVVHERSSFTPDLMQTFHSFASTLSQENMDAFLAHCATIKETHALYHGVTGKLAGFQMFSPSEADGRWRIIRGGKLRLAPDVRGLAFPHMAGLVFYQREREAHEAERRKFYRISIASPFGFNSLHSTLAHSVILSNAALQQQEHYDAELRRVLLQAVRRFADANGFVYDAASGTCDVRFKLSPQLIAHGTSASFMARPSAQLYASVCPQWPTGLYVCWAWALDEVNCETQLRYIKAKAMSNVN